MARVVIPITQLALNDGVDTLGTAMDTTNHHELATSKTHDLILHAVGGGVDGTVFILPGVNPPALLQSLGTASIALGTADEKMIYLESGRFVQADGKIYINVQDSMTGTLAAYRVNQAGIS